MKEGVDGIQLPQNFVIQKVRQAAEGEGSWVSMTFAPDGSLYVSPQSGVLLRFSAGESGALLGDPQPISFPVGRAQGLCWAFDSLYANVAGNADADGGLHRLRDNDGDGIFDEHVRLVAYGPGSEHGAHAILDGGDGWLYSVWGNHVKIPAELISPNSPLQDFSEDVLLPGILDPRGHAHGKKMPAGTFWRFRPDGTNFELLAGGMRNSYDVAMTASGEWFAYDSDMEWDIGTPWFRPPRLLHLVAGGDYGWRTGSTKLDPSCPDTLPSVVDTDFASPTGMLSTHLLANPEKYDADLLMADWAYGRLLRVKLTRKGASFTGEIKVFGKGRPWNISDLAAGPDGALWVLTGGRGTPSAIYRISPTSADFAAYQSLEETLAVSSFSKTEAEYPLGSDELWRDLSSEDRWTRWRARLQIEQSPNGEWAKLLGVSSLNEVEEASYGELPMAELRLALSRSQPDLAATVWKTLFAGEWWRNKAVQLLDLRTAQVILVRHAAKLDLKTRQDSAKRMIQQRQNLEQSARRLADEILVSLMGENLPLLFTPLLNNKYSVQTQMHAAYLLRLVTSDWAPELQLAAVKWSRRAQMAPGGASLEGFLNKITADLRQSSGAKNWDEILKKLPPLPTPDWSAPPKDRPFVTNWTTQQLLQKIKPFETSASAERGYKILAQASCLQCHRFNANGKGVGPDLTGVGRRFDRATVLESIVEPTKVVSDQYRLVPMPAGLLNHFTADEIADLVLLLELGAR